MSKFHQLRPDGLQLWTDFEGASGVRAFIIAAGSSVSDRRIRGDTTLEVRVPIQEEQTGAVAQAAAMGGLRRAVIRQEFTDDTVEEWRVVRIQRVYNAGAFEFLILCEPAINALRGPRLCEHADADGTVRHTFETLDATPAVHLADEIIPSGPTWVTVGTVEPTARVDLTYDRFTPLRALRALEEATGYEAELVRQTGGAYLLNLVAQVGKLSLDDPVLALDTGDGAENTNMEAVTGLLGFSTWDVDDLASVQIKSNRYEVVTNVLGGAGGIVCNADVRRDLFDYYADFIPAETPDVGNAPKAGLIFRAKEGAGHYQQTGDGWEVSAADLSWSGTGDASTCDILIGKRVAGTINFISPNVATGVVYKRVSGNRFGVTVIGSQLWVWTEPYGGGARTTHAGPIDMTQTIGGNTDPFNDDQHQRFGIARVSTPEVGTLFENITVAVASAEPAVVPRAVIGMNATGIRHDEDDRPTGTVVYAQAGDEAQGLVTIAEARFVIVSKSVNDLVFGAGALNPIWADGALEGFYLGNPDGTGLQLINTTVAATATMTVASGAGFSALDEVALFETSGGKRLAFLEDPVEVVNNTDRLVKVLEVDDVPPARNLVGNPALRLYTAGAADDTLAVGIGARTENTDRQFAEVGEKSLHVTVTAAERGVESAAVTIAPTDLSPYFAAWVKVWIVSGAVRFELEHSVLGIIPGADAGNRAVSTVTDSWVQIQIAPGEDLRMVAGTLKLRVVSEGAAAEWYLDAWQLTQTPVNFAWFGGNPGNALYDRAAAHFVADGAQPRDQYTVSMVDLSDTIFPTDSVVLGRFLQVESEELGVATLERILRVRRDHWTGELVTVELSSRRGRFSDLALRRLERLGVVRAEETVPLLAKFIPFFDETGELFVDYGGNHRVRSVRYAVSASAQPSRADAAAGASNDGRADRFGTGLLTAGDNFLTLIPYDGLAGAGKPGPVYEWSGRAVSNTGDTPRISTVVVTVDDADGSATIDVTTDDDPNTQSFRWASATGAAPAYPSVASAEAGAAVDMSTGTPGEGQATLGASSVAAGDKLRVTVLPYATTDGTPSGTHGAAANGEDTRSAAEPEILTFTTTLNQAGTGCGDPWREDLAWTTDDVVDGTHDLKIYRTVEVDGVPVEEDVLVTTITDPVTTTSYTDDQVSYQVGPVDVLVQSHYRADLIDQVSTDVLDQALVQTSIENCDSACITE